MTNLADMPHKVDVLGIGMSVATYGSVVDRVLDAAHAGSGLSVSATAVHGVMEGVHDPEHAARLNEFDILTPDGQPVRWAMNWLHDVQMRERVYGPTLMLRVCERAAIEQLPIYLYGSTPETLELLVASLHERYPGLVVAGIAPSRFEQVDEESQRQIARDITASGARIVFVGLGCPRQEIFVWAMRDRIELPLLAVGAAFDFHAGLATEAPDWMQDNGLQWAHRLAGDPKRLWRRYLLLNPEYAWRVAHQKAGIVPRRQPAHPTRVRIPA